MPKNVYPRSHVPTDAWPIGWAVSGRVPTAESGQQQSSPASTFPVLIHVVHDSYSVQIFFSAVQDAWQLPGLLNVPVTIEQSKGQELNVSLPGLQLRSSRMLSRYTPAEPATVKQIVWRLLKSELYG